ncbi:unnamed protein product [Phyllotreta striolata]|uniref:RNA helicase n=1 Tax=Phyllotreta striolata TaxID=444603 RepID=A0A9N9U152_PHYSR|nr:unnamed protein product [Phyllotreta striolata]
MICLLHFRSNVTVKLPTLYYALSCQVYLVLSENFIIELLEANIIQNYKAKTEQVSNFYQNNYYKVKKLPFRNFKLELWVNWYVRKYTKTNIIFDTKWIDYLKKCSQDKLTGKKFITENKCLLCDFEYKDQEALNNHVETESHKIRVQYVVDKSKLELSEDVAMQIIQPQGKHLIVNYPIQVHINLVLRLTNKSNNPLNFTDVIVVNSLIKEVCLQEEFEKGVLIEPDRSVDIKAYAYFENSRTFNYPVIIVTEDRESGKKTYHLKEIAFEITSELSSLKPESEYVNNKPNVDYIFAEDAIIPGEKPFVQSSYTEAFPLQQYKIPKDMKKIFEDIIRRCPQFIEEGAAARPFFSHFSMLLNVCPPVTKENYHDNMAKLLHIEENQMCINMKNYDLLTPLHAIRGSRLYSLNVPGLAEDRPSILVFDRIYVKENKHAKIKYEGYVHHVMEEVIHVGLHRKFDDIYLKNKHYFIEFAFNRRSIRAEKQALLLAEAHQIVPSLFPSRGETILLNSDVDISFANTVLNEEQRTAVKSILPHKNFPFVIFGPPGTGKTVVVVEAAYQIWRNYPNSKILLCAPSNSAANEIAVRLMDIIPKSNLFRLLGRFYASALERRYKRLDEIINVSKDGTFYIPAMEELLNYRILITTIVTAARLVNGGTPMGHFTHVFIDESGYSTETQTLIPIAGILSNAQSPGKLTGQIVLAGDPKQLGPVVQSGFARHCGYGVSLLERLINTCDVYARNKSDESYDNRFVTQLVRNYRSHRTILTVPNELFYCGQLIAAGNDFADLFVGWQHLKNEQFPIVFHHVEGEDVREKTSPSFFNVQEIEVVVSYLEKIFADKVKGYPIKEEHVGIITPYRKQAEKLRKAVKKKWSYLSVGSVEEFQGKEKLIVIISTVRSKNNHKFEEIDKKCQLGFLKNPKRFNVALTRAKALLIVIGNGNVLKTDSNWSSFIRYCSQNNSIAGKGFQNDAASA